MWIDDHWPVVEAVAAVGLLCFAGALIGLAVTGIRIIGERHG